MSYYKINVYQSVNGLKPKKNAETQNNMQQASKFYYWAISNLKAQKKTYENPKFFKRIFNKILNKSNSFEYKVELVKVSFANANKIVKQEQSPNYKF